MPASGPAGRLVLRSRRWALMGMPIPASQLALLRRPGAACQAARLSEHAERATAGTPQPLLSRQTCRHPARGRICVGLGPGACILHPAARAAELQPASPSTELKAGPRAACAPDDLRCSAVPRAEAGRPSRLPLLRLRLRLRVALRSVCWPAGPCAAGDVLRLLLLLGLCSLRPPLAGLRLPAAGLRLRVAGLRLQ